MTVTYHVCSTSYVTWIQAMVAPCGPRRPCRICRAWLSDMSLPLAKLEEMFPSLGGDVRDVLAEHQRAMLKKMRNRKL